MVLPLPGVAVSAKRRWLAFIPGIVAEVSLRMV
jgi:hypothetical protein